MKVLDLGWTIMLIEIYAKSLPSSLLARLGSWSWSLLLVLVRHQWHWSAVTITHPASGLADWPQTPASHWLPVSTLTSDWFPLTGHLTSGPWTEAVCDTVVARYISKKSKSSGVRFLWLEGREESKVLLLLPLTCCQSDIRPVKLWRRVRGVKTGISTKCQVRDWSGIIAPPCHMMTSAAGDCDDANDRGPGHGNAPSHWSLESLLIREIPGQCQWSPAPATGAFHVCSLFMAQGSALHDFMCFSNTLWGPRAECHEWSLRSPMWKVASFESGQRERERDVKRILCWILPSVACLRPCLVTPGQCPWRQALAPPCVPLAPLVPPSGPGPVHFTLAQSSSGFQIVQSWPGDLSCLVIVTPDNCIIAHTVTSSDPGQHPLTPRINWPHEIVMTYEFWG